MSGEFFIVFDEFHTIDDEQWNSWAVEPECSEFYDKYVLGKFDTTTLRMRSVIGWPDST